MNIEEYLSTLNIRYKGEIGEDNSYVIDIPNSQDWGSVFTKLDKSEDLEALENNQVITEQGSSLVYQSLSEPLLISLIADFEGDRYQLIVNQI